MKIASYKNDTDAFIEARDALRSEEMKLRDRIEEIAAMRRALPQSSSVDDYQFKSCPDGTATHLSELFKNPDKPLVIQHYMFGGAQSNPCSMCSLWVDGFQGAAAHINEAVNFAIIAEADPAELHKLSTSRNWNDLEFYSCLGTSFKSDFGFENDKKEQYPGFSIFERDEDGTIRHTYSASAFMDESEYRGMDLTSPLWNLLDLTPGGRGDFMPRLQYGEKN